MRPTLLPHRKLGLFVRFIFFFFFYTVFSFLRFSTSTKLNGDTDPSLSQKQRFELQHAFGVTDDFSYRGILEIDNQEKKVIIQDEVKIDDRVWQNIQEKVTDNVDVLYRLRLVPLGDGENKVCEANSNQKECKVVSDSGGGSPMILTSTRLCLYSRTSFYSEMKVYVNHYHQVIGFSVAPKFRSPTSRSCSAIKEWSVEDSLPFTFETFLSIEYESPGKIVAKPNPQENQLNIAKPPPGIGLRPFPVDPNDPNSAPGQRGIDGGKQNQSFLGKYGWYLLIGYLALSVLVGGGAPPEGQQEGSGQSAQQR